MLSHSFIPLVIAGSCGCPLPYTHYKFPQEPAARAAWKSQVYRKNWSPKKSSVVCSKHFVDGKPTALNPLPTLYLGYSKEQKLQGRKPNAVEMLDKECIMMDTTTCSTQESENWLTLVENDSIVEHHSRKEMINDEIQTLPSVGSTNKHFGLNKKLNKLRSRCFNQTLALRRALSQVKKICRPKYKQLLNTNSDVLFYTGIPSLVVFNSLCKFAQKSLQKTSRGQRTSRTISKLLKAKYNSCSFTPVHERHIKRLCIADRILLTLMKLRLGLLHRDLSDRLVYWLNQ